MIRAENGYGTGRRGRRQGRDRRQGVTLVEGLVVTAIGSLVFGMVLASLVQTSRASGDVTGGQQMRQEALLIGQAVEKTIRFRVDAADLAAARSAPQVLSAVAATTATAGGEKKSTVPRSMEDALATTASAAPAATPTPAAARTPTAQELTSVPATLKPLLSGTTETAAARAPERGPGELYAEHELAVYSLAAGADPARIVAAVRNSRGLAEEPRHAYIERSAPGAPEDVRTSPLGSNSDKLQSAVSFRYATEFDGLAARWTKESPGVPKLIEYTVRVWPKNAGPDPGARNKAGRAAGFEYTSAVRVR